MSCCEGNKCTTDASKGTACGKSSTTCSENIYDDVKDYYGKRVQSTSDLQTGSCKLGDSSMGPHIRDAIKQVHSEVKSRYYGCGLVIPDLLEGMKVLDLGSGAGLDCFVLSKLVGENGHVTGLDMTDEQLEVARNHISYHTEKFGYKTPNVEFVQGYIEKLEEAGIKKDFYDFIVSNCVVNLSPDKEAVLREAYKVLKVGGELYFSDIYSDTDLPEEIRKHKVLWGECIAGALNWKELYELAEKIGFSAPKLVTASHFDIDKKELLEVIGDAQFISATYRLFKMPEVKESSCGVVYEGMIPHCEDQFKLDHTAVFKTGDLACVNSEVATILKNSRFHDDFTFQPSEKKPCCDQPSAQILHDPFEFARRPENAVSASGCCGKDSGCN